MRQPEYDFIVIGQGLAGSILAYALIKRGLRVLVVDNSHHHSASKVAAGIINPISGLRLSLSESFGLQFTSAKRFYKELQLTTKRGYLRSIEQLRLLSKSSQHDYLQKRLSQAEYQPYIGSSVANLGAYPGAVFGTIAIEQTAVVDTKSLLADIKEWLINNNSYLEYKLDYQNLKLDGKGLFKVADKTAKQLIFCEGYQATNNPWLRNLPFKLAKGEVLNIKLPQQRPSVLLNWGKWLLPSRGKQSAKLGATFDWNELNHQASLENQSKLLNDLLKTTLLKGEIIDSEVGIRPSTVSRTPFIGEISALPNAYCFNGFGSKGCLLIPYYADIMCGVLTSNKPLPEELTKWL